MWYYKLWNILKMENMTNMYFENIAEYFENMIGPTLKESNLFWKQLEIWHISESDYSDCRL